jgi:hypothetical protein
MKFAKKNIKKGTPGKGDAPAGRSSEKQQARVKA